jgi:hypothetical protein
MTAPGQKPSRARKDRGMRTQRHLAEWFQANGFPHAESTGSGRPGRDLTGMGPVFVEAKATAAEPTARVLRKAHQHAAGDLACVIYRPPGYGPANLADWPVTVRLADFTALIRAAGHGDRP